MRLGWFTVGKHMAQSSAMTKEIGVRIGFCEKYFMKHYGIEFDMEYYTDIDRRIETDMFIERKLYKRFADLGMGNPDPEPTPAVGFSGNIDLCAMFGAKIEVMEDGSAWVEKGTLRTDEDILSLEVPNIEETWPQTMFIKQFEKYSAKFGIKRVRPPRVHGMLEIALDLRKEELFVDMLSNPLLARKLLETITETIINVRTFWDKKKFGKIQKGIFLGGCSSTLCSPKVYEEFLVPYYNILSDRFGGCYLCSCGLSTHLLEVFTKIRNCRGYHLGWGTDIREARKILKGAKIRARLDPQRIASGNPDQVRRDVVKILQEEGPTSKLTLILYNASADTPDENIRAIFDTVKEYGTVVDPQDDVYLMEK